MAHTYTDLSDESIAHKKPITLQQGRALRDNPIAIAEGAPNAPRLRLGALERVAAGDELRSQSGTLSNNVGAQTGGSTVTTERVVFGMLQAGSIRVGLVVSSGSGGGYAHILRRRGAAEIEVLNSTANSGTTSADLDVMPGDAIVLVVSSSSTSSTGASRAAHTTISTDGVDLFPGVPAAIIGATLNA